MAISDRVVIMKDGVICQQGTPTEIYEQPNSRFVANFIGKANFIDGTFRGMDGENAWWKWAATPSPSPPPARWRASRRTAPAAWRFVRSLFSSLRKRAPCPAVSPRATYYGAKVEYEVMLGDQPIIVEVYNPPAVQALRRGRSGPHDPHRRCVRVLA